MSGPSSIRHQDDDHGASLKSYGVVPLLCVKPVADLDQRIGEVNPLLIAYTPPRATINSPAIPEEGGKR